MFSERHGRHIALLLIVGAGLTSIARAMSLSFVAIRLQQSFGLGPAMIGALLGIGPLLGAVAAPLAGTLSDRLGRKWVLGLTLTSMALSLTGLGLAGSATTFCLAQIACAVAVAIYEPISRALMSDACPSSLRLQYFSWRYTVSNVGWAVGPLIGVAAGVATRVPFFVAGVLYVVFAVALFLVHGKVEARTGNRPELSVLQSVFAATRDPRLAFFVGGGTLLIAIYGQWSATLSPYLTRALPDGIGIFAYMLSINGIVVLVGNTFARRLIMRLGALGAMVLGCLLFCAGELGFLVSTSFAGFAASMVVFTLGEIFVVPSEYMLVDGIADADNRGSYFGAHAFSSIGNFVGPTLGGLMLGVFGGPGLFLLFAGFAVTSAVLFSVGTRMPPPRMRRSPDMQGLGQGFIGISPRAGFA